MFLLAGNIAYDVGCYVIIVARWLVNVVSADSKRVLVRTVVSITMQTNEENMEKVQFATMVIGCDVIMILIDREQMFPPYLSDLFVDDKQS